jgi:hypothetical protein
MASQRAHELRRRDVRDRELIVCFDSEKASVADAMIDSIEDSGDPAWSACSMRCPTCRSRAASRARAGCMRGKIGALDTMQRIVTTVPQTREPFRRT